MKHIALIAAFFMLGSTASADDLVEFGKRIAEANCASCHAISTDDASKHKLAPPLRELSKRYPIDALEEAFVEGIYSGHPDMPQFKATTEQVDALLAYISSVQ